MNFSIDDQTLQSKLQAGEKVIFSDGEGRLYEIIEYKGN